MTPLPVRIATPAGDTTLAGVDLPLDLNALLAPDRAGPARGLPRRWEIEIGFGKGRFLLGRCAARPETGFVGIEVVSKYYRMARRRARRRGLGNFVLLRGEARFLTAAVLPRRFARAVHVYFPDPWPKSRHQERRLLDPESIDLLLRLLEPGGRLLAATDHADYGAAVADLLGRHPELRVEPRAEPWPDGARTNYEAKYMREGRPIMRIEAHFEGEGAGLHPAGVPGIVSAVARSPES